MRIVLAATIRILRGHILHVDAVPGRGSVIDEALAPLLAIGKDIETNVFLLAQGDDRGVVLRLAQRVPLETEGGAAAIGGGVPP